MEFYIKDRPMLEKPYHLSGIGLPNVYLLNGVEIEHDPDYGKLVTISDIHNLHHAIGFHIVSKPEPMTGDELRFLRKQMQATQTDLAHILRVDVQTIANYEKGKTKNLGTAEVAMRMIFTLHIMPEDAKKDFIKAVIGMSDRKPTKSRIPERIRKKINGPWHDDGQRKAA